MLITLNQIAERIRHDQTHFLIWINEFRVYRVGDNSDDHSLSNELNFTYLDPRVLIKNSWNPNKMSPEAESKLRNSIQKNGHIKPILVRELDDGQLEIVGGEHRVDVSIDLGMDSVPVLNLGRISDEQAKKALLIDNSRYGEDEATMLAALLEDIGTADDLAEWTTYNMDELNTLLGSTKAAEDDLSYLDELSELGEEDDEPLPTALPDVQTHQVMKFKVPVEDAHTVKDIIDGIAKAQKLDDSDSAVRSGDALLWLIRDYQSRLGIETTSPVEDVLDDDELGDFLSTLEGDQ